MRLAFVSTVLLACPALAGSQSAPPLEPGKEISSEFPDVDDGLGWRRHAFTGRGGERVAFVIEVDAFDDVVPTPQVKITDAAGEEVTLETGGTTKLEVRARLPADGTFTLHLGADLPSSYVVKQLERKVAPVLAPGESFGVWVTRRDDEYLQISVSGEHEGKALALSLGGPTSNELMVALRPAMNAPPLSCEGGPCEGNLFVWPAKRGTYYLHVRANKDASGTVGLVVVPAFTRPLSLGKAVEERLTPGAPARTFVFRSRAGDFGVTLTRDFSPRLRLEQLKAGALGWSLPLAVLEGRVGVPLSFGEWLITVSAEGKLPSGGGTFRLEVGAPRRADLAEMLGAPPTEPIAGKVAVVDVARVLAESADGKAAREKLTALKAGFEGTLAEKQKGLSGLQGEAFVRQYALLEAAQRELGLELAAEEAKASALIFQKLRATVSKLKQERGLELVVNREVVAWGAPSADLTPAVLEALVTGKTRPGPAPQKIAVVDLTRAWGASRLIDSEREKMSKVAKASVVEKAMRERFFTAANAALEKLARRDGLTLVLVQEGLTAEFGAVRWKSPPPDLTEDLRRLVDGD